MVVPVCSQKFLDFVPDGGREEIPLDGRDTCWRLCGDHIDSKYTAIGACSVHSNLSLTCYYPEQPFSELKNDLKKPVIHLRPRAGRIPLWNVNVRLHGPPE